MKFALLGAAFGARLEVCRLLVDEWAADVNQETIDGTTPLIGASGEGHVDVVNFLIERGANLDHTDMDGYNALMCTVKKGRTEMARHLVAIGTSTDQIGTDGKQARDLAEESKNAEMNSITYVSGMLQVSPFAFLGLSLSPFRFLAEKRNKMMGCEFVKIMARVW
ncbi:hypothetical protein niasHT_011618 [Heterodera trifolii]|uniref:Uncharacterized protein n=1 Tax=Heterodera trifolii TaxID=157864 RepID=A0ABD2LJE5_9BILA